MVLVHACAIAVCGSAQRVDVVGDACGELARAVHVGAVAEVLGLLEDHVGGEGATEELERGRRQDALGALDQGSRVYNLGNGQGFSVMEVIETAREVTGSQIPHVMGERRPGDPAVLTADSRKIRAELGWTPRFPELRAIVESARKWNLAHPRGYAE